MNWKDLFGWLLPKKPKEVSTLVHQGKPIEHKEPELKPPKRKSIKIDGWQTQFSDIPEDADKTQVVIGLDFGTAFTKVVIDTQERKYGVPLNNSGQGTDKYLLATCLYENTNGKLTVTPPEKWTRRHDGFKMKILDGHINKKTKKRIIIYLAWVLRKSRRWVMIEKRAIFGDVQLVWKLNVGLPTENYHDSKLKKTYREFVEEAWYRSTDPHFGSNDDGDKRMNDLERRLNSKMIGAFPEFAAQVRGYISSQQWRHGVHLIIDVGAGTVDATVFITHELGGEKKLGPLTSSVKQRGTNYLATHRYNHLTTHRTWQPSHDGLFPSRQEFANNIDVSMELITNIDNQFKREIIDCINVLLKNAKEVAPIQKE